MITIKGLDKLVNRMRAFKDEVRYGLLYIVRYSMKDLMKYATDYTPMGDSSTFKKRYDLRLSPGSRMKALGIINKEGFARGSWQFAFTEAVDLQKYYGKDSGEKAKDQADAVLANLKFAQINKLILINKGPYIKMLENGFSDQAPDGIMEPTIDWMRSYMSGGSVMKEYYIQGKLDVINSGY